MPIPHAVGLLELLWHFTAKYSPQGDVGKWDDQAIAEQLYWEGDPSTLIGALVACGWVDEDERHRLIVHDWSEHADEAVHFRLAKSRLRFADGRAPNLRGLNSRERAEAGEYYGLPPGSCNTRGQPWPARASRGTPGHAVAGPGKPGPAGAGRGMPEPVSEPVPEPVPEPVRGASDPDSFFEPEPEGGAGAFDSLFERIWRRHPKKIGRYPAERAWASAIMEAVDRSALAVRIDKAHESWCRSEAWTSDGGKFAPRLDRWLMDKGWLDEAEPPGATTGVASIPIGGIFAEAVDELYTQTAPTGKSPPDPVSSSAPDEDFTEELNRVFAAAARSIKGL